MNGPRTGLEIDERQCFHCNGSVEDHEIHVLMTCPLYKHFRDVLFEKASNANDTFNSLDSDHKFVYLLSDNNIVKTTARICHEILQYRRNLLYKN